MEFDRRGRLMLRKLAEGCLLREAATIAGVWKQILASLYFSQAVTTAREEGTEDHAFCQWLGHYRRGMRPPTGKGHGGKAMFAYGRR